MAFLDAYFLCYCCFSRQLIPPAECLLWFCFEIKAFGSCQESNMPFRPLALELKINATQA